MDKQKNISPTASDNAHFIGFPAPIYKWLQQRRKTRGLRSIPATVVEIIRDVYLSETETMKKAA